MSDASIPEPQHRPGSGITLAPYDAGWSVAFQHESSAIRNGLSDTPITLHHIGSTSIPGIIARPVIDLLGVVPGIRDIDAHENEIMMLRAVVFWLVVISVPVLMLWMSNAITR